MSGKSDKGEDGNSRARFATIIRGEGGVGERGEFLWMIGELDSWVLPRNSISLLLLLKSMAQKSSPSTVY